MFKAHWENIIDSGLVYSHNRGILVKLVVNMVSIAKSFVVLGLVALAIGTIICYQDWVQVLFLLCMIISAFLVLYGSVFVDVVIDLAREKIERIILA